MQAIVGRKFTFSKMADCMNICIVQKPNTTSSIWNYFGVRADDNDVPLPNELERPICKLCKKAVSAKRSNTTNLHTHLKDNHPDAYATVQREKTSGNTSSLTQPTLVEVFEKNARYDPKSSRAKEISRSIAVFLAKDMQPFYTVEKPGFRQMIKKLDPKYVVPTRKYFSQTEIPMLYTHAMESVKQDLKHVEYFAATTDLWTSAADHPYLSLTVHFIGKSWELKSYCLDTVPLLIDHTGENIAETLNDVLANWNLDHNKLVATTTDNGSNFVAAFQSLEWERISCFGHNLDLSIGRALKLDRVETVVRKCHKLVELFSRSWKKSRDLHQKQVELGLKQHKLVADVSTRWGSTCKMICRIIEQQQAICAVLADERKNWYRMPSDNDFSTLEAIASVLKPLNIFTDALSAEKCITVSAIRPLLKHILGELLAVSPDDTSFTKDLKEIISDKLQAQYLHQNVAQILDVCSFLDPRFRIAYLADKTSTLAQIESEACEVTDEIINEQSQNMEEITQPAPSKKLKGLAAVLKNALPSVQPQEQLTTHEKVKKEIDRYLDLAPIDPACDPVTWWKTEAKNFPALAILARKYLCICGTSVPSERLFSKGGYIVNGLRCRLSPDKVNMLLFLSRNMSLMSEAT